MGMIQLIQSIQSIQSIRPYLGIWVTVAVTFKVAVNATAEQRVFVRRRCRQWTRTGYHRCHTEWRGHHPVPDSTSPQQQWSAPGAPGSHLAPGTWHKTSVKSSDTLNCDPAKKVVWPLSDMVQAGAWQVGWELWGEEADEVQQQWALLGDDGQDVTCPMISTAPLPRWSTRQLPPRPPQSTSPSTNPSWRSTKQSVSSCQPGIKNKKPLQLHLNCFPPPDPPQSPCSENIAS